MTVHEEVSKMPQGAPAKKEKKKPKKDAAVKGVRASTSQAPAPAVEIIGKKRKQRDEV
ncbi:MAG TPA: hypothetical protein VGW38_03540 [Chloroflexota bacterium]|nr:hypothetical protein [Chloroflexota bacterium]